MVLITFTIVILRYAFNSGGVLLQESVMYLHGTLFMMAIPLGVSDDTHVRVDILYSRRSPEQQAWINLVGHILFLLPVAGFMIWVSLPYVSNSWQILEVSSEVGGIPGRLLTQNPDSVDRRTVVSRAWLVLHLFCWRNCDDGPPTIMNLTPLALFAVTFAVLLAGYPVASNSGWGGPDFRLRRHPDRRFQPADLGFAAGRLFGIITNQTLIAVPLFFYGCAAGKNPYRRRPAGQSVGFVRRHREDLQLPSFWSAC